MKILAKRRGRRGQWSPIGSTIFALLCACALWSCGDSRLSSASGNNDADSGPRERPAYNPTTDDDGNPIPPGDDDIDPRERCCVLIPASGDPSLAVGYDSALDLGAFLFNLSSGAPFPNETVEWSIDPEGAGARLSARNAITDSDGLTQIRFDAGTTAQTYTVTASHSGADPISYTVEVLELPIGSIEVDVRHPGASLYDVGPIRVRLFERANQRCEFMPPGAYPADYFIEATLVDTTETAHFENLLAGENYTILATGFGDFGEIAAQGCADNILVEENVNREIEIVMQLLPLNPVGQYDVRSWWDFTEALLDTGSVGEIIVDILDLFENPGEQLVDYLLDALGYFIGSWVSDVIDIFLSVTGLDTLIEDGINDLINSSDTLRDFFSIGCDLRRMVTRLQILSVLDIGKIGSDFEVFGVDTWTGLAVCDFTPDPDFTVGECDSTRDCGRIPIVLDNEELGLLRGDWTGRVLSYNHLSIDRHAVDFNYGRLILFILEYWIFPSLTGDTAPVTLEDVIINIIDCESLAEFVTGSDGEICLIGCISGSSIEGFCEDAIGLVFGTLFRSFVDALSFDSVLELRGEVTLVNEDADLDVEILEDGEYTGTIFVDSDGSPFSADFEGDRRDN